MIIYTSAATADLEQILALQRLNLPKNISEATSKAQGFVTIEHDLVLLQAMNTPYPHVIAKVGDSLVGYTLVMLPSLRNRISMLIPLFDRIDRLVWKDRLLTDLNYFVMGQVCVAKDWRGKGVFKGLYQHMQQTMSADFDVIVTEIATRNTRSMRAHEKVGFEVLDIYQTDEEEWAIVGWDWNTI
ncbi:MAG: GNAT family N-acetyltransferase [Bacteroidota bacterium]